MGGEEEKGQAQVVQGQEGEAQEGQRQEAQEGGGRRALHHLGQAPPQEARQDGRGPRARRKAAAAAGLLERCVLAGISACVPCAFWVPVFYALIGMCYRGVTPQLK